MTYDLDIIQISRRRGEQLPVVQWVVARRYSEFFQLHQQLKRFFSVRQLEFPRRRMVMKLQRDFLEKRRRALESYLEVWGTPHTVVRKRLTDKSLILLPEVCRSIEFRAFLSEQSIETTKATQTPADNRRDIMTRLYNSIADGVEDVLGNLPILDQLSMASANIIATATGQPQMPQTARDVPRDSIEDAEAELSAFEDRELEPFVKPICDLFLEVFELNRRSNWFRGRAVVVVLHQLLGGTIERFTWILHTPQFRTNGIRKIRDQAKALLDEESLLCHIKRLGELIWPTDGIRQPPSPRTSKERQRTKKEASETLATLIPGMSLLVTKRIFPVRVNSFFVYSFVYSLDEEMCNSPVEDYFTAKRANFRRCFAERSRQSKLTGC